MADLSLRNVTKIFPNGFVAVKDVSLDIGDGEEVVIVGPPNCGKSEIVRMIAGLEEISEGEILIDGQRVNEVPTHDRGVGMMFQNGILYPDKTVAENMAFGLEMRREPKEKIEQVVEETAKFLGIADLMGALP